LLGGAAVGFTLSKIIQLPTHQLGFDVLGSQLGVELSTSWLSAVFIVGLVITGAHSLFRDHPLYRQGQVRYTFIFWILSALTALVTGASLARVESTQAWLSVMVGGIILLGVVTANEFKLLDPSKLERPGVQLFAAIVVYTLALALLTLIYATRTRALLAGPAAFAVSSLLTVRFLWNTIQQPRRIAFYGGITGLIMSQAVWALNYWRMEPLAGGLLLLLIFYVVTGIEQQFLLDQMSRRVLIEYGVVVSVAAVVILSLLA